MKKSNATLLPLVVLCADILSEKNNLLRLTDVFVFRLVGLGSDERQDRRPVGRCNRYPAASAWYAVVRDQAKSKKSYKKLQTSVLIPNKQRHVLKTKVGIWLTQA